MELLVELQRDRDFVEDARRCQPQFERIPVQVFKDTAQLPRIQHNREFGVPSQNLVRPFRSLVQTQRQIQAGPDSGVHLQDLLLGAEFSLI